MARKPAPTKATGGGGFGFEDPIAAYYALHLLAATRLYGDSFGRIVQIDYQARDKGWLLDDLVVTFEDQQGLRRAAYSIKSNRQITEKKGFPDDFVNDVWEQWLRRVPSPFQEGRDRLVLAVGELAESVRTAWSEMVAQARSTSPDRFVARFTQQKQSSALQRRLFESLACPPHLRSGSRTDQVAAALLVAHLDVIPFDFGHAPSNDWARLISVAQSVLESGNAHEANHLVESLCFNASKLRPQGGVQTLLTLLNHVRGQYALKEYRDYQADWEALKARTNSALGRVRSVIGSGIALNRSLLEADVSKAIAASPVVVLFGESGCGKSALAKELAAAAKDTTCCIWLGAGDLEGSDLHSMSSHYRLQHRVDQVLLASKSPQTYVIFDALDRASASAVQNACELIISLTSACTLGSIRIIITADPNGWSRLQKEFTRALPKELEATTCPVGMLEISDVREVLLQVRPLRSIAVRSEVCSLLRNPKILDWVVSAVEHGQSTDTLAWVGVTHVIDWVWQFWVGDDSDSIARSALLRKLGNADGDSLSNGLPVLGTLDHSEAQALGTASIQRLVRVENERCYFQHDLAGDWARLRTLLGRGDEVLGTIVEKAAHPRWHKAIRYYGQRLLEETPDDPTHWHQMLTSLGSGDPPSFAHDLLLESVVFATNADALLELIWPVLAANEGSLLRRLLRLFLHSATFPYPRVDSITSTPSEASQLASLMRIPYVPYWIPMLRFLNLHHDDVAVYSIGFAAKISKTWLEAVPLATEDSRPFPGRQDAAELAVRLGRELQFLKALSTYFEDDVDETVYEAVLFAAPDLPETVSSLSLQFAQRKPWDDATLERVRAIKEDQRKKAVAALLADPERRARLAKAPQLGSITSHGPLREPWPDGPCRRVDDAFQKVCHERLAAFQQLIAAAPLVAREVALATCIEEPQHEEIFGWGSLIHERCGLAHWSVEYPDAFFRGCFLSFLRANPTVGLDLIITLVDFSTECWIDASLRAAERREGLPITALGPPMLLENGESRSLLGNGTVYGWYRLGGMNNEAVTCALMALEKWLYEEVEAGRDISSCVHEILKNARSVSFVGVLVALGLKHPHLFLGCLKPVLSVWPVYAWQEHLLMNGDVWRIEMTSWAGYGETIFNIVRDWHSMPHRKYSLRQTMLRAFVLDSSVQQEFKQIRSFWSAQLTQTPQDESLELLLAHFDIANYRHTPQVDGTVLVEFEWPEPLRARTEAALQDSQMNLLLIDFPSRCRQILDRELTLSGTELSQFVDDAQRIFDLEGQLTTQEQIGHRVASVFGAAAVLFALHRDHLTQDSALEARLLDLTKSMLNSPSVGTEFDIAESAFSIRWDCFACEFLSVFLAERSDDEWVRGAFAAAVMGLHYNATGFAAKSAFMLRERLGDDWARTQNMLLIWAGLRCCWERARDLEVEAERYLRLRDRLINAFIEKSITVEPLTWTRIGGLGRHRLARIENASASNRLSLAGDLDEVPRHGRRRRLREHPGMNVQVLEAAFDWIPLLSDAATQSERTPWIALVENALHVTLGMLPESSDSDDEINGTPYKYDYWVLKRAAVCIAQMTKGEDPARLWRPILDLGGRAHCWISAFIDNWFVFGVRAASTPQQFAERWGEMIDYALTATQWTTGTGRHCHRIADLISEMMGLSWNAKSVSEAEFSGAIDSLIPRFEVFASRWLRVPRVASLFGRFLTRVSSRRLLPDGVKWLCAASANFDEYSWRHNDLEDAILAAVRACWFEYSARLQTDLPLRHAFLEILDLLNRRQNASAFELRDEVARSIPRE